MHSQLSAALRSFLTRCISSVEQVEILLLLRANRERAWSIDEISTQLRSSAHSVQSRLAPLVRSTLVERREDECYCYTPGADEPVVAELAQEYENRRVRLIEAIFSRPIDSARSFADAFRLWERDDDR